MAASEAVLSYSSGFLQNVGCMVAVRGCCFRTYVVIFNGEMLRQLNQQHLQIHRRDACHSAVASQNGFGFDVIQAVGDHMLLLTQRVEVRSIIPFRYDTVTCT